ncbi:hypothetical protein BO71DRAFT_17764 [Aspergillus ellipticus CBS 707.79]|uniref:Uncharacterized protein n=1 Tax=Aspergillus ellipticus CBS 707.79 TaxID=1448320 RepID=A0A319DX40_9EURO|nr:hypothetical protein BO71DRAFT_17764 [Aspergillus ellipticus CBS 707.79]
MRWSGLRWGRDVDMNKDDGTREEVMGEEGQVPGEEEEVWGRGSDAGDESRARLVAERLVDQPQPMVGCPGCVIGRSGQGDRHGLSGQLILRSACQVAEGGMDGVLRASMPIHRSTTSQTMYCVHLTVDKTEAICRTEISVTAALLLVFMLGSREPARR